MKLIVSTTICAALWCLLTEARAESWIVGVPVVLAAAITGMLLAPRRGWRWSVFGFLRFLPYFARNSFIGGFDVAWRSLRSDLPIDPRMVEHRLRLPAHSTARVFFMNVVNLQPGTVSADVRNDVLKVHVIDGRQPTNQQLDSLERVVAALFSIEIAREANEGSGAQ